MAVIQYGSIVTEIKGSLGGHTFKSQRGSFVIMQKSNGYSRSKQLSNRALGYAAYIFQRWSKLSESDKEAWNNEASSILFPDKYGNQVHISGRELFTKLQLQLGINYYYPRPIGDFSPNVSTFLIIESAITVAPQLASFYAVVDSEAGSYLDVFAEVSTTPLRAPVFQTRELLKRVAMNTEGLVDFTTEFFNKFPYVINGYYVRFYITILNEYGFKGITTVIDNIVGLVLPVYAIISADIYDAGQATTIVLDSLYDSGWFVFVWASYSTEDYPPDDFNSATAIGVYLPNTSNELDLSAILLVAFPELSAGDYVRFYTKLYQDGNTYGAPQTITAVVGAPVGNYTLDEFVLINGSLNGYVNYDFDGDAMGIFRIYAKASAVSMPDTNFEDAIEIGTHNLPAGSPFFVGGLFYAEWPLIDAGWFVRLFTVHEIDDVPQSPPVNISTIVT